MRKIKDVLRLRLSGGLSIRQIRASTKISVGAIHGVMGSGLVSRGQRKSGSGLYICIRLRKSGSGLYICIRLGHLVGYADGPTASHRIRGRAISRDGAG